MNETESMVKGAKAGEAHSWHCAGNELVWGGGLKEILAWQHLPIRVEGPHLDDS